LAISRRFEAQMQLPLARGDINRNQEGFRKLAAVNGDRVNLVSRIGTRHVPAWCVPRSADADADDPKLSIQRSPLALNSQQPAAKLQREVVAAVFGDRL
jgi:hypothetical protein